MASFNNVGINLIVVVIALYFCMGYAVPVPQQFGNPKPMGFGTGFGDTNYSCSQPGSFVRAPDGCNRCYCELDGKLSSACSKVLCPSPGGFPSGTGRRPVFSNYQVRV